MCENLTYPMVLKSQRLPLSALVSWPWKPWWTIEPDLLAILYLAIGLTNAKHCSVFKNVTLFFLTPLSAFYLTGHQQAQRRRPHPPSSSTWKRRSGEHRWCLKQLMMVWCTEISSSVRFCPFPTCPKMTNFPRKYPFSSMSETGKM